MNETFIDENSGFFASIIPTHDDVDQYFSPEAFAAMFGDDTLPAGLTYESLRETAHEMIDERAADAYDPPDIDDDGYQDGVGLPA